MLSSATINATLTLFGRSLYADALVQQIEAMQWLMRFALLIFLSCRLVDYEICRQTQRACFQRLQRSKTVMGALVALPTLLATKAVIRAILGFGSLLPVPLADLSGAERKFGPEQYQRMKNGNNKPSINMVYTWLGTAFSVAFLLAGQYYTVRAFRDLVRQSCGISPAIRRNSLRALMQQHTAKTESS